MLQSSAIERSVSDSTHLWKCQLAKNKELLIPPIWDCCGPTEGSFFTHGQIKHPAFFEGWCYTGKMIRQMLAESAVCLNSYLWRGWMFYLAMGKKWSPSGSTTTPDRWYQKFFFLANWHFQWCVECQDKIPSIALVPIFLPGRCWKFSKYTFTHDQH